MSDKFVLSDPAKADLKEIWSYIAQHNPKSADKLLRQFKQKFQLLAENPQIGKSQDRFVLNLRAFFVKDYVIFYFPAENGIEIYRVLHGARNIEDLFEDYFEGLKP